MPPKRYILNDDSSSIQSDKMQPLNHFMMHYYIHKLNGPTYVELL